MRHSDPITPATRRLIAARQIKFARKQLQSFGPDFPTTRAFLRGMIYGVAIATFRQYRSWIRSWWLEV